VYAANATQVLLSLGNMKQLVLVKSVKNALSRRCIEGCGCMRTSQAAKVIVLAVKERKDLRRRGSGRKSDVLFLNEGKALQIGRWITPTHPDGMAPNISVLLLVIAHA